MYRYILPPGNSIISLGLEVEAHRLKNNGSSVRKIAEALTKKCGTKVHPNTVQRYFDSFKKGQEVEEVQLQLPSKEAKVALEILEEKVTTVQEVDKIIKKLERIIDLAEKAGDNHLVIKAAKELVRYYDIKAKLTGDIGPKGSAAAAQNNILIYIPDNGRD